MQNVLQNTRTTVLLVWFSAKKAIAKCLPEFFHFALDALKLANITDSI